MGWNNLPCRISRYEQEHLVPSRQTIQKLSATLGLAPDERGFLLMQARYLPTDEEVAKVLQRLQPFPDQWPAPAYLRKRWSACPKKGLTCWSSASTLAGLRAVGCLRRERSLCARAARPLQSPPAAAYRAALVSRVNSKLAEISPLP